MREDTKVILVLTIATLVISASSMFIIMEYGLTGRVTENVNATFTIAVTTTSTSTTSTTSTSTTSTSTTSTVAPTSGGGGGGGGGGEDVIVDFDVIIDEPLQGYIGDTLVTKVKLVNGDKQLTGIGLRAESSNPFLQFVLTPGSISQLKPGEEIEVDLIISTIGPAGSYLVNIFADVNNPKLTRRGTLFVDLIERAEFNKTIIVNRVAFTKDLFRENPECLELNEVLENADTALAEGRAEEANQLVETAVRACRDLITSKPEPEIQQPANYNALKISLIVAAIGLLVAIGYEVFRYRLLTGKLQRRLGIVIVLGLLAVFTRFTLTGFATQQGGSVLDLIDLKILIAVDIILLITYLRLRFTRY